MVNMANAIFPKSFALIFLHCDSVEEQNFSMNGSCLSEELDVTIMIGDPSKDVV